MPLIWPPFRDVPTSKTLDEMKWLAEEIHRRSTPADAFVRLV